MIIPVIVHLPSHILRLSGIIILGIGIIHSPVIIVVPVIVIIPVVIIPVVIIVVSVIVIIVVSVVIVVHEIYLLINGAKCSLNNCGRRFFISGF